MNLGTLLRIGFIWWCCFLLNFGSTKHSRTTVSARFLHFHDECSNHELSKHRKQLPTTSLYCKTTVNSDISKVSLGNVSTYLRFSTHGISNTLERIVTQRIWGSEHISIHKIPVRLTLLLTNLKTGQSQKQEMGRPWTSRPYPFCCARNHGSLKISRTVNLDCSHPQTKSWKFEDLKILRLCP
jgi:hypothetical protein